MTSTLARQAFPHEDARSLEGNLSALGEDSQAGPSSVRPFLPPSHPISLKLRAILARPTSSHDDELAKRGLRALEEMYAVDQSEGEPPKRRSKKRRDAAKAMPTVDVTRARANFEQDAQRDLLAAGDQYVEALSTVDAALSEVQAQITSMRVTCDSVDQQLTMANNSTRYLLEQAEGLQRQKTTTEQQRALLDLFLARFTLRDAEKEVISKRDAPVDSKLFAAMDRLSEIRSDCRSLLEGGGELGGGTRAGMDIMAATSSQMDEVYDKIARYLNFQFRQAPKEGMMDVSKNLRESVERLIKGNREDLLRPALSVLATIRANFMSNTFHRALTQGTSGSRPIELHAHDPVRYVGDILAWIHQAVASEREFLGQVFGEKEGEGGRRVGERRKGIDGSIDWTNGSSDGALGSKTVYVREMLDRCLEGCGRPLRVRIEQTVHAQEDAIVALKMSQLIQFYAGVMANTLGNHASLSQVLSELFQHSQTAFLSIVDRSGSRLAATNAMPSEALSPPAPLLDAINTAKELLTIQASVASEAANTAAPQETVDAAAVAAKLVEPMLASIAATEETIAADRLARKAGDSQVDAIIVRVNSLERILELLAPHSFAEAVSAGVRQKLDEAIQQLVGADYANLLSASGLSTLLEAGSNPPEATVNRAIGHFTDTFLSSSTFLASPLLERLASPRIRSDAHHRALQKLAHTYEELSKDKQGTLWRSATDVRMLLGVE